MITKVKNKVLTMVLAVMLLFGMSAGITTVYGSNFNANNIVVGATCTKVATGGSHTIAALSDGTVWTWGGNYYGQLGIGTSDGVGHYLPLKSIFSGPVTAAVAGSNHTVVAKSDGTVWACGLNHNGQLGLGYTDPENNPNPSPMLVKGFTTGTVTALAAGANHTVALKSDGTVWAWGWNRDGQLGVGTTEDVPYPVQMKVSTGGYLTGIIAIAAGANHTVALKSDGTVWTCGGNDSGQLGIGTSDNLAHPSTCMVQGITGITAIAGGSSLTKALRNDGTVWSWGWNIYGQLGNGTTQNSSFPVQAIGLSGVSSIGGGGWHTIALKSDGTAYGWGQNQLGELGTGNNYNSYSPTLVQLPTGGPLTTVASGSASSHTVAIQNYGSLLWAWGNNNVGQLGIGYTVASRNLPTVIQPFF